jgi:hypothetical protein
LQLFSFLLSATLLFAPAALAQETNVPNWRAPVLIASANDIVDFNTKTLKYHSPSCIWAKRCTEHCIKISRAEAKQRGGIPCKVCGASE